LPVALVPQDDEGVRMVRKLLTVFTRSTQVSEAVIALRMGINASKFVREILPNLLENNILKEVQNRGGGNQRRFRLGRSMESIAGALAESRGNFERLMDSLRSDGAATDE
jgi:hypothetical protein